ncbi:MAG: hypothetical protein GQ565_00885 [Candidatus Aegiribacteria sp.]|nr:hypothetical protein [Candidatus Aegiribacteria sp.]
MKWSEIGLIILALAAVAGLFSVVTGGQETIEGEDGVPEETNPLMLIERDFAEICCGTGFRDVPSASADTIVKSMDLLDTISVHQANLYITRTLRSHGFGHVVTYRVPDRGLSFLCHTPDGEPMRFELNDTSR